MYPLASSQEDWVNSGSTPSTPNLPAIEELILKYWDADGTFQASIDNRPGQVDGENNEFVFYDGPPFANGLPHYGHLLTSYVKDLVARYQTQQGRRVERRFGWDTHGLPAELEAMKQLGMTDKAEIEEMGIDKFNDACRASVLEYTQEWEEYINRMGRWVDFENGVSCAAATGGTMRPEPITPATRGAARREAHLLRGLACASGVAMCCSLPCRVVSPGRPEGSGRHRGRCPSPSFTGALASGASVGSPPTAEPGGHTATGAPHANLRAGPRCGGSGLAGGGESVHILVVCAVSLRTGRGRS